MKYEYKPSGVCARSISLEIEDDIVKNVVFHGGCNGNGKGVAALVQGLSTDEVINRLSGITCANKKTSCPNELATAVRELSK